jgi:RND family efflux transporter MFP subunit
MRKALIFSAVLVVAAVGTYFFSRSGTTSAGSATAGSASPGGRAGGMGGPGGGAGAMGRPPMTVDVAAASRATITEELMVVGNLIGLATVDVVPKVSGRLQAINVRLGDSVRKGQVLALLDDREIREQVRQAEASYEVGRATIRQREADLRFAETNLERSRSLFARQLLPQQTLDDADARQQAAAAQLDLSRAQFDQAKARLDELRLTLENTRVVSPVDGFVARRQLDVGAFASSNAPVVSVVDIEVVRLVANLVEKDLRRVQMGTPTRVDVDAYPGETFDGRVARVAPVLDPATRTAQMEVEIPNPQHRLKPGMYARVALLVSRHDNALVVPRNAVVDIEGQRGVFLIDGTTAKFHTVSVGIQNQEQAEILSGLTDGQKVVTTGSNALRDGDPIVQTGQKSGPDARPGRPAPATPQGR